MIFLFHLLILPVFVFHNRSEPFLDDEHFWMLFSQPPTTNYFSGSHSTHTDLSFSDFLVIDLRRVWIFCSDSGLNVGSGAFSSEASFGYSGVPEPFSNNISDIGLGNSLPINSISQDWLISSPIKGENDVGEEAVQEMNDPEDLVQSDSVLGEEKAIIVDDQISIAALTAGSLRISPGTFFSVGLAFGASGEQTFSLGISTIGASGCLYNDFFLNSNSSALQSYLEFPNAVSAANSCYTMGLQVNLLILISNCIFVIPALFVPIFLSIGVEALSTASEKSCNSENKFVELVNVFSASDAGPKYLKGCGKMKVVNLVADDFDRDKSINGGSLSVADFLKFDASELFEHVVESGEVAGSLESAIPYKNRKVGLMGVVGLAVIVGFVGVLMDSNVAEIGDVCQDFDAIDIVAVGSVETSPCGSKDLSGLSVGLSELIAHVVNSDSDSISMDHLPLIKRKVGFSGLNNDGSEVNITLGVNGEGSHVVKTDVYLNPDIDGDSSCKYLIVSSDSKKRKRNARNSELARERQSVIYNQTAQSKLWEFMANSHSRNEDPLLELPRTWWLLGNSDLTLHRQQFWARSHLH